ncbi:hypothetical protein HPP92_021118 [Vanilla planifolia]|uniref:Uncharacterized protein n=1 Tax=Vanilla planifolia TaxID=51239 RepID=A0A835PUU5_VANPL|nr:hypothetical protein HPP92_021118 [Vanilla planifolia]
MGNPRTSSKKNSAADSELHAAARAGDLRAVESICSSDPLAINSRDRHSRTPLHLAAWSGHANVVKYLCNHKADAGAAAMDDTSAIHFASQKGHVEVARILLSFGVSVKTTNRKGMTPLHFAVQGSHQELIKYLMRKGASLGAKNKTGETPLDLVKSDEVRSLISQWEKSPKNEDQTSRNKEEESKPSDTEYSKEIDNDEDLGDCARGDAGKLEKRKIGVTADDRLPDAKKAKVPLLHLIAEDDAEE